MIKLMSTMDFIIVTTTSRWSLSMFEYIFYGTLVLRYTTKNFFWYNLVSSISTLIRCGDYVTKSLVYTQNTVTKMYVWTREETTWGLGDDDTVLTEEDGKKGRKRGRRREKRGRTKDEERRKKERKKRFIFDLRIKHGY